MNDIATHLTAILGRLSQAVAAFVAIQLRGPQIVWLGTQAYVAKPQPNQPATLASETWILLTHRISRIAQRFRTLFARYQAGTLPAPRPSRAGAPSNRQPETSLPAPRFPGGRGWIGAHIQAAAPCTGTLDYLLLNTPQMQQFVQAAPQAGRLLRPLCRMLGLTLPEYLRLPSRPKPPASRPPPACGGSRREALGPQSNPEREAPTTPDRPLQPEIRAAARAWKKYDR